MNNINKLLLTSALVVSGFSVANAQVSNKNFVGPSVEVGVQHNQFSKQFKSFYIGSDDEFSGGGAKDIQGSGDSTLGRLGFNYGIPSSDRTVITLGATYSLGKNDPNTAGFSVGGPSGYSSMLYDKMYSLYIAPTYAVNDSTAVFGKVSYNRADSILSSYGYDSNNKTIQGFGLGVGITTFITKDIFIKAEVDRIDYGSNDYYFSFIESTWSPYSGEGQAKIKSVATNATISLGVKF